MWDHYLDTARTPRAAPPDTSQCRGRKMIRGAAVRKYLQVHTSSVSISIPINYHKNIKYYLKIVILKNEISLPYLPEYFMTINSKITKIVQFCNILFCKNQS